MRIVIKPAGLLLVLAMIGVLTVLAVVKKGKNAAPPPAAASEPPATVSGNMLANSGFEGGFSDIVGNWKDAKGKAKGMLGSGWSDDSLWGPVVLEYAEDHQNPHSGASSQRIKMLSTAGDARCQFVQAVAGKTGTTYRQSIWVRASRSGVPVTLLLRQKDAPYAEYKSVVKEVGTEWKQITLDGSASQSGGLFMMVSFNTPGAAIWIDDATMTAL